MLWYSLGPLKYYMVTIGFFGPGHFVMFLARNESCVRFFRESKARCACSNLPCELYGYAMNMSFQGFTIYRLQDGSDALP